MIWSVVFATAACANSPTTFTYQGQLKQNGVPVNGQLFMNFRLWDAATGGNFLGLVSLQSVPVTNGLFSVSLDFGADAFSSAGRWLQIELVTSGVTLSPRQPITASPMSSYSLAPWVTSGNDIYYNAGKVGMGYSSPVGRLHVYPQFFGPAGGGGIYLGGSPTSNGFTGLAIDLSAVSNGYASLQAIASAGSAYGNIVLNPVGGKVGIGNGSDTAVGMLEIDALANTTALRLSYSNGGSNAVAIQIRRSGSSRDAAIFQSDVGSGSRLRVSNDNTGTTSSYNELLDSGVWSFGSDRRLKRDIRPLAHNLDKSLALRPVSFFFNHQDLQHNPQRNLGFIAQEVRKVLPELVHGNDQELLTLDYTSMVAVAIGAVNELHAKTEAQLAQRDKEISDLRAEVKELRGMVEQINPQRVHNKSQQTVSYGE